MQGAANTRFSGIENLEVMRDAVNYNRYLLDLIRGHAGDAKRVIDFGAGSGTFAGPVSRSGFEVTAVELDEGLRAQLAELGLRVAANTAILPPRSFEFAYTLNVLEHISDDVEALRHEGINAVFDIANSSDETLKLVLERAHHDQPEDAIDALVKVVRKETNLVVHNEVDELAKIHEGEGSVDAQPE